MFGAARLMQAKARDHAESHTCGVAKKFPVNPAHPERNCWGCDMYCAADAMACGNGSERTQHPVETWGEDWMEWGGPQAAEAQPAAAIKVIPIVALDPKG